MVKINFLFNEEKDLLNIYDKCNKEEFASKVPVELVSITKGKSFSECVSDLKKYRKKIYSSYLIPIYIDTISKGWVNIEKEYFRRLGNITKNKFPLNEIKGYITTIGTCPYNDKEGWFMVSLMYNLLDSLKSIGHELMHLHFHHYYFEDIKNKLGREKTHDLKESLTVLLNLEFQDLWFTIDKGYPKHKELREFIEKEWDKEKDFNKLLNKCVDYIQLTERRLEKI